MSPTNFLSVFVLTLVLSSCGGDSEGGSGNTGASGKTVPPEEAMSSWRVAGRGSLPESETVTEQVRVLEFGDRMVISYDGSSESGNEEICRREQDGDHYYQVCMPLEDDPFFVALESNAFVWHPLMFDRFATDLECRSWEKGDAKAGMDCISKVFPSMGGEGFTCEAGLVNGDKALKCSDGWAVVVNGEEEESKTVCRVLLSDGSGRCLGAPKEGVDDEELIVEMQRTLWGGHRSHQENNEQFAVGDVVESLAPEDLPEGARLSYRSEDEDICTVDNDDSDGGIGTVTILPGVTAPVVCTIFLKVEGAGFAERTLFAELPVLKANDVSWPRYRRPNNYFYPGETLEAQTLVHNDPASTENEFKSLDESVCTVDTSSGEVIAVAAGECTIRLAARSEGYLDVTIEHVFPVDARESFGATIGWSEFDALDGATDVVGTTVSLAAPQVSEGTAGVEYVSGGCAYTYNEPDHDIEFVDATECVLMVTATGGRGSEPVIREFRFTPGPGGIFTIAWTGYTSGNAATYGSAAPEPESVIATPLDLPVTLSFSASGGGCEVDGTTGALTILGATVGTSLRCEVTLNGYHGDYTDADPLTVTVDIAKKAQTFSDWVGYDSGEHTNAYVGAYVAPGESAEIVKFPTGGVGDLEYKLVNCSDFTIDSAGGTVTANAGASVGSSCIVEVRWLGDDNHALSNWFKVSEIEVNATAQAQAVWNSDPYGFSPTVKVGESLNISTAPTRGTGSAQYHSITLDVCTVGVSNGTVTAVGVGDGTCAIEFRYRGSSTVASSPWSARLNISVTKGTPTPADDSSYYGVGAQVAKGGILELVVPPEGYGAVTYLVADVSSSFCSIEADSGTIIGIDSGDCTVQVEFAGNDDYNALDVTPLQTVTVGGRSFTLPWNPYKDGVEYRVGSTGAIGEAEVGDTGATVKYEVVDEGETGCSLQSDGVTLSFTSHGICTVRARGRRVYYDDWVAERILRVRPAAIAVTPGAFPRGTILKVGGSRVAPVGIGTPTPSDAVLSWELVRGERDCVLENPQTGAVSARVAEIDETDPPVCSLKLVARKEGFDTYRSEPVTISLAKGDMGTLLQAVFSRSLNRVLPGGFLDMQVLPQEVNGLAVTVTGFSATGYESDGNTVASDVCTVDNNTGRVTVDSGARAGYKCVVTVTVSATGYADKNVSTTIEIVGGELSFATTPTLSYTGELKIGMQTPLIPDVSGLPATDDRSVSVGWDFVGEARDANGNPKSGVCGVDTISDDDPGYVRLERDTAAVGDVCVVYAIAVVAEGYVPRAIDSVELMVVAGDLTFTSATKANYSGRTLRIDGSVMPVIPNSPQDDNNVAVSWGAWRVEGLDSDGSTAKSDVCSVDEDGRVEAGSTAQVGDICKVYGVASAPNYNGSQELELGSLIVAAKGMLGTITGPVYSEELTLRGYPISVTTGPSLSPSIDEAITWTYRGVGKRGGVKTADICSVNENTGEVTQGSAAQPTDTCEVYAIAEAFGYDSKEAGTASVLILKDFFISLSWTEFSGSVVVGTEVNLSSRQPVSVPQYGNVAISKVSGDCDYNGSNVLSFSGTTECVIKVVASKTGYISISETYRVTPDKGTIVVDSWGSYTAVNVGTTANPPALTFSHPSGGTGVSSSYATASDSEGCMVHNSSGMVEGAAVTTSCKVVRILTATGYNNLENTYTISVGRGSQDPPSTWSNPYGAGPEVAVGAEISASNKPTGEGALEFHVKSGNDCRVNGEGDVTGLNFGSCTIQAQFVGNTNYNPSGFEDIAVITVIRGTQDAPSWSDHPYVGSASPSITFGTPVRMTGTEPTGEGDVQYRIKPGDTNYCEVDGEGVVTALAVGVGEDCIVQAQFVGNTNYNPSGYDDIATLNVLGQSLGNITWGAFTGTLEVGGNSKTPSGPVGMVNGSSVNYAVTDATTVNCVLENGGGASGEVIAIAVDLSTSPVCELTVTVSKAGHITQTTAISIPLSVGTLSVAWGNFDGNLVVNGDPKTPSATTSSGATVIYTLKSESEAYCELRSGTTGQVEARVVDVSGSPDCVIVATVTRLGYTTQTQEISISLQGDSLGNINWSDFPISTNLVVGGSTVTPSSPTGMVQGASVTYGLGTPANCDLLSGESGEVRAKEVAVTGSTVCTLTVTVSKLGYITQTQDISINLQEGIQGGVAWSPGVLTYQTSDSNPTLGTVTGGDSADSITYGTTAGSSYCDFGTDTSSVLTLSGAGTCTVQATVTRTGYADWTSPGFDVVVSSADPVDIAWAGYANSNTISLGETLAPLAATLTPGNATPSYGAIPDPSGACRINSGNGTVTADGVGFCYVTLSATDPGGTQAPGKIVVAVRMLALLDFSIAGSPTYAGSTLGLGFWLDVDHLPGQDDNSVGVTWSFAAIGTRGTSEQTGVCSVDNTPESDTFGRIMAGDDAVSGDVCTITATAEADGHVSQDHDIELTLRHPHPVEIAGFHHSYCVLFEGGRVKCWGQNDAGQLGIGDTSGTNVNIGDENNEIGVELPYLDFGSGARATQISVGQKFACAVLDDGTVKCWGEGADGRLGTGNATDLDAPGDAVNLGGAARQVSAGGAHACAVLVDGSLKCWGRDDHGQIGDGTKGSSHNEPQSVSLGTSGETATYVSAGGFHTCAILTGGALKCWGYDAQGQLGDGTKEPDNPNPSAVPLGTNMIATHISLGGWHSCAVLKDSTTNDGRNTLKCWGHDDEGQVGNGGSMKDTPSLKRVAVNGTVGKLFAGSKVSCALLSDNSLKCWGKNDSGQLGIGSTTSQAGPGAVLDLGNSVSATSVALGANHSCAILSNNTIKCWGQHIHGSLGYGAGSVTWGDDSGEMGDNLAEVPIYAASLGEIVWGAFSGNLVIGGSNVTPSEPTGVPDGASVSYRISDGTASNCVLESGGDTSGEVSASEVDISLGPLQCTLIVTVSKPGYNPQFHEISIPLQVGNLGSIGWGDFTDTHLVVGGARVTPGAPTGVPNGASIRYTQTEATQRNCTLHNDTNGEVSANVVDISTSPDCALTVSVSKLGYITQTYEISVPLQGAALGTITWGSFAGGANLAVGKIVTPEATVHPGASFRYVVTPATAVNCELLNEETGAVRAKGVAITGSQVCSLEIIAGRIGYITQTHTISITLVKGTQLGLAWSPGVTGAPASDGSVTLGTVTGGDSGNITYEVTGGGGTNCAFDTATSSVLTFDTAGTCTVQARVTRTGYNDWTSAPINVEVTSSAPVGITWNGYSDGNIVNVGESVTPMARVFTPGAGVGETFSYSAVPADACTVNAGDGTLAANSAGTCYVTVTATHSSRSDGRLTVVVRIPDRLDFTVAGNPTYRDTTVGLGASVDIEHFPGGDDNGVAVEWSFAGAGTRYGFVRDGICSVDNDPASNTFGQIRAGADTQIQDVCTVTVVAEAAGFAPYSDTLEITLRHPHPLQVSSFKQSSCVLFEGGRVKCWGRNNGGQLGLGHNRDIGDGNGEMAEKLPYLNFGQGRRATQIDMGLVHACAVLDNGEVKCWGSGASGRLGYGDESSLNAPASAVNLGGVMAKQVSAGGGHSCAVLVGGTLKCWGDNDYGQIGDGSDGTDRLEPVTVDLGDGVLASFVSTGFYHTCAVLTDGGLKCWGSGVYGRLGDGHTANRNRPVTVDLGDELLASSVTAGHFHTCAVLTDGGLKCWGRNYNGQVGDGTLIDKTGPVAIDLGEGGAAFSVSLGSSHTCAVLTDGVLKCWGNNLYGQLGVGNFYPEKSPVTARPGTGLKVKDIALATYLSCAVLSDHTAKCWGAARVWHPGYGVGDIALGR